MVGMAKRGAPDSTRPRASSNTRSAGATGGSRSASSSSSAAAAAVASASLPLSSPSVVGIDGRGLRKGKRAHIHSNRLRIAACGPITPFGRPVEPEV